VTAEQFWSVRICSQLAPPCVLMAAVVRRCVEVDLGSSGAVVAHVRHQFAEVRARVCGKLVARMAQVVKVNAGQAHDGKGGRQQPDTKIPEAQLREAERQAVGIWHDFRSRPGCSRRSRPPCGPTVSIRPAGRVVSLWRFRVDPGEEMTRAAENLTDLLSSPRSAPEA
jgi:hypothetical protein